MPTFSQLGFHTYEDYCNSNYFTRLKDMVRGRKCFICRTLSAIIAHHVCYRNLGQERMGRDIYPVCFDCHAQIHHYTILIFKKKTPLKRPQLLRRMIYLRAKYVAQNNQKRLIPWYILRYVLAT